MVEKGAGARGGSFLVNSYFFGRYVWVRLLPRAYSIPNNLVYKAVLLNTAMLGLHCWFFFCPTSIGRGGKNN